MVRMRTAKSLLREIQTQDPDTEITLHYLRKLIASGAIPVVHVGRKNLVDMDLVLDYLSNSRYPIPINSSVHSSTIHSPIIYSPMTHPSFEPPLQYNGVAVLFMHRVDGETCYGYNM